MKSYKTLLILLGILYVAYHFITLAYSPLPWFDEICFASISDNYAHHHTFYLDALALRQKDEVLSYGPLYFILQALVMKVAGMSIFAFRILNMVSGFIDLWLVYKICKALKFSTEAVILSILLIAFDPSFNQNLHSGRMEFVTLFFFLSSYLVFTNIKNNINSPLFFNSLFTGILLGCAMLTTPRIVFAFSFYIVYLIYEIIQNRKTNLSAVIVKFLLAGIGFTGIYLTWIIGKFGGINSFINYYTSHPILMKHIGGVNLVKLNYHIIINIYMLLCFIVVVMRKKLKKNVSLLLFSIPPILAFFILVKDISDIYYALILPFIIPLLTGISIDVLKTRVYKLASYTLVAVFLLVFIFKSVTIFTDIKERDSSYFGNMIAGNIRKNSSVAGDFQYYYIAKNLGCSYQGIEENGEWDEKINYFKANKYDYFIINKWNENRDKYEAAILNKNYTMVAFVHADKQLNPLIEKILKAAHILVNAGYDCYVYRRNDL